MANRYWRGGSGTWDTTSTANWSTASGGLGGASVPTAADSVFFDQAGTYSVTMTGALNCLDITVSAGSVTFATGTTPTLSVAGSMAITAGTTTWSSTGAITFTATTAKTITSGGTVFDCNMTLNGAGGTWTLQDNLTLGTGSTHRTFAHSQGTLALGSYTLTTHLFTSNTASTRTLDFGTGKISTKAVTTATVFTTSTVTGLTVTGTPLVEFIGGGAAQTFTITTSASTTEAGSISFDIRATAGTVTLTAASRVRNLTFANTVFTYSNTAITIFGNLTIEGTNVTLTAGANALTFAATSGTKTITTNGEGLDFPITFNGTGGTFQIVGTLTVGVSASRVIALTNGIIDFNNQTLAGTFTFVKNAGTATIQNLNTTVAMPVSGGVLVLGSNVTTGAFSLTVGTIQLVTYTYTTTAVTWSSPAAKVMNFGTSGKFRIVSSSTGTIVTGTSTAFTVLGTTPLIESTGGGTGVTKTITMGPMTEAISIGVSILETSGTVTYAFTNPIFRDFKIDSVTGTTIPNIAAIIYGNYTYSTVNGNATITAGTNAWTFAATSGTDTISTGGYTHDMPFTFNGVGGTWVLQDALTIGSGRLMTLTNGTLNLNGFNCTAGTFTTGAGTKNISFNGGTLTVVGSGATAFNNANPTGFTTTAGTSAGTISMTSASAKTFVGGGSNYAAKINQGGAGTLTITGSNTLDDIANGYVSTGATTITLTSGTTQTLSSFTATGFVGRVLTLNSSVAGSAATLSKSSGTVSVDYLSIRDSTATGGATWYAGANSTNVSNNTGWLFVAAPATAAFFMLF